MRLTPLAPSPMALLPVQSLDARTRLYTVGAFALVVVSCQHLTTVGIALLYAAILWIFIQLPFYPTVQRLATMDGFIVVLIVLLPFTTPGEPIAQAGILVVSREGLYHALLILLKANAIVLMNLLFIGTLEPVALGQALQRLYVPTPLIHLLLLMVRYLDVLQMEYQRLRRAMRIRAFQARTDWHTWRSVGYLIGLLLVRASERAERVWAAMRCRGFRGRYPSLHPTDFRWRDGCWLLGQAILLGLLGWIEWG